MTNVAREQARMRRLTQAPPPAWLFPGAVVNYHSVIGGAVSLTALTVREAPFQNNNGDWVVFLTGKSGYVACAAVSQYVAPAAVSR